MSSNESNKQTTTSESTKNKNNKKKAIGVQRPPSHRAPRVTAAKCGGTHVRHEKLDTPLVGSFAVARAASLSRAIVVLVERVCLGGAGPRSASCAWMGGGGGTRCEQRDGEWKRRHKDWRQGMERERQTALAHLLRVCAGERERAAQSGSSLSTRI